jgi:hyaluronate lyase
MTPVGTRAIKSASAAVAAVLAAILFTPMSAAAEPVDPLYELCPGTNSDEFPGSTLNSSIWTTIVKPADARHRVEDGALVLPTYMVNSPDVPFVQQPLPAGAWEVTTEVTISPTASYQQAGLNLWRDSNNYAKVDTFSSSGTQRMQFIWRNAGTDRNVSGTDILDVPVGTGATMWLRLTNDGTSITARYSIDGANFFTLGRNVPTATLAATKLGVSALRGATSTAPEIEADFNWVRWSPTAAQLEGCGTSSLSDAAQARLAWRDVLTGGASFSPTAEPYASAITRIDAAANSFHSSLDTTPDTELWSDLDTTDTIDLLEAYRRVKAMALAWATNGSSLESDSDLLADTIEAADWLNAHRFNSTTTKVATTWWYWEIGVPLESNDLTVLLYDQLSAAQIDAYMDAVEHFSPTVTRTGANRIWAAMVVGLRGVIVEDSAKITAAQTGVVPALQNVTSGDGFYADGSFVQHTYFAYTGGYGLSLIGNLGRLLVLLNDTPWEITDPSLANAYAWIPDSFDPVMHAGELFDSVRGREISRDYNQDHVAGASAMRATLLLAETAPTATAASLRSIVKRWIGEDPLGDVWSAGTITELRLAQAAVAGTVIAAPSLVGNYAFNGMDRATQHASAYSFAVSMSSSRIANYEVISSQNMHGWYTGDGMTHLYSNDSAQYSADFWATVNPYRLAGTTVDTSTKSNSAGNTYLSPSTYAGSLTSSSGLHGTSAMMLDAYGSTTPVAKKSWFYFDDEVVALGAGITAAGQTGSGWNGQPKRVETIIDNRKISSGQALTVDGTTVASTPGLEQSFADPAWAHLSGTEGQVGYVMPGTAPLAVLRESRTGKWSDINITGPTTPRSNTFMELYVNHGTNPTDQRYSYVVLPNATSSQTQAYSTTPEITVLANNNDISAVKETTLNIVGANFWTDTTKTLNVGGAAFLVSNKKAQIMTEESGPGISVTVADPTQANTGTIAVEIKRSATSTAFSTPDITITQLTPTIKFTVNVNGAKGKPSEARFNY